MRRRDFIKATAAVTTTWPLALRAEQSERMRRIGVLMNPEPNEDSQAALSAFVRGLRELGWTDGSNVRIETRWAGGSASAIRKYAAELVALAPDVIFATGTVDMAPLLEATRTVPIVFVNVTDPLGQGVVPSLAHPGGNITGFSFIEPEMVGKWINLLSDVKPGLSRVALMFNPDTAPFFDPYYRSFKAAPQQSAVEVEVAHVRTAGEIVSAIAKLGSEQGSALILGSDIFLVNTREPIIRLANERGVPAISAYRQFVVEGSLMAYGPDTGDISRRASEYVHRILKGEQPGNLPVQSPIRFDLIVNLKTAKALGMSPRESFLELCDEVIE